MHSVSIIVFLTILSLLFAVTMLVCGKLLSPKAESKIKNANYECGMQVFSDEKILINPRYFLFALMFLIYDAEIILLFPFALAFERLRIFVFIQAVIFIFIMLLTLVYAVQKNMLRFK